jgi:hypothetical protein
MLDASSATIAAPKPLDAKGNNSSAGIPAMCASNIADHCAAPAAASTTSLHPGLTEASVA